MEVTTRPVSEHYPMADQDLQVSGYKAKGCSQRDAEKIQNMYHSILVPIDYIVASFVLSCASQWSTGE